ncbi:MAG: MarR family transcriptional regulator [Eubacteriales bacterium]|nr:MarR family transcriptional regulator [Eubacteriales bacterium]
MLQDDIYRIYAKLKLYYYRRIFRKLDSREEDALTAIETFCAEAIYGLGRPNVTQFAEFVNVSQPNAAYKISSLEKKGYIRRIKSPEDGRIVLLEVTEKFLSLYGSSERYAKVLAERIRERFSPEDVEKFEHILEVISTELMQEVNDYLINEANLPEENAIARSRSSAS